jgi:hypothetical protein
LTVDSVKGGRSNYLLWAVLVVGLLVLGLFVQNNLRNAQRQTDALGGSGFQQQSPPQPRAATIVNSAATVDANGYASYTFVVPAGATSIAVNGHFAATGGSGNDIECYIMDEDGFANLKNGHPATTLFNSGKVTQAKIGAALPSPGTYYLMFDNRFSLFTPKAVQVDATLNYLQ